jgi:SDR family mycofactocin-dependent oxidoreductase
MGKLDGKVAFITGAARGQGRSHAQLLAEEGADIVGIDVCRQIETVGYPMSTAKDLEETVRLVKKTGRRMVARQADVRDTAALSEALAAGQARFGRLDIVCANAGIMAHQMPPYSKSEQAWQDSIGTMLTGVWNTLRLTAPILIQGGRGGSIVITSSTAGLTSKWTTFDGGFDGYTASKFGVVGLMRSYAGRLAQYNIRVNTVHPTGVATPMVVNDYFPEFMKVHSEVAARSQNALPVPVVEAVDVSRAVLYLVSDDGRYVTGSTFTVDAGLTTVAGPDGTALQSTVP